MKVETQVLETGGGDHAGDSVGAAIPCATPTSICTPSPLGVAAAAITPEKAQN